MRNILMLFLTFGLINSLASCYEDDRNEHVVKYEVELINNSGISPINITYYTRNYSYTADSSTITFSKDTTFIQCIKNLKYGMYDSIKVDYNGKYAKMHYPSSDTTEVGNLCNENCYTPVVESDSYCKYSFTFDPIVEQ